MIVVSPDQSLADVSAIAPGVNSRTNAATAELIRILTEWEELVLSERICNAEGDHRRCSRIEVWFGCLRSALLRKRLSRELEWAAADLW